MISDLKRIIDQISRDRGFDKNLLVEAIEEAVASAARKKLGSRRDIEVRYNEEFGEVEVFQFRSVVENAEDEQTEISLEQAQILDPEVQLGNLLPLLQLTHLVTVLIEVFSGDLQPFPHPGGRQGTIEPGLGDQVKEGPVGGHYHLRAVDGERSRGKGG